MKRTTISRFLAAAPLTALPLLMLSTSNVFADSFATQVFALGTAVNSTAPDSVTVAGNSVWVEYGNGASSTGGAGNSTIVQYSTSGAVQNTYSLTGSVDGLKYNPNTGQIWALHNQDANSTITIINPTNGVMTNYTYGVPYNSASGTRGFDDVAFVGNQVFLSETNPASTADSVVVSISSLLNSPITQTSVATGAGILATDPDSLKSTPNGGLILSGEGDHALTFITNPGTASQSAKSIALVNPMGATAGQPDDVIMPGATAGTFYVADTAANTVYKITASGLTSSLYGDVGGSFGSVNATTGLFTSDVSGVSFHGVDFTPAPEPSTLGIAFTGLAFLGFGLNRKRRKS